MIRPTLIAAAALSLVSAGAGILVQMAILGTGSVTNLALTVIVGLVSLLVSLVGNYLIAMRRGAETLDVARQKEITGKDSTICKLNEETRRLQKQLAKPQLSLIEERRSKLVKEKLTLFPATYREMAKLVLQYVLEHGKVPAFDLIHDNLMGALSNPDLIEKVLEQALHTQLLRADPSPGPWTSISVVVNPDLKTALSSHLLGE